MNKPEKDLLADITVVEPPTTFAGVRASTKARRAWLRGFPVCAALGQHQIAHVGLADGIFRVVRQKQSSTYFLACYGGEGRVWVDGRWRRCRAGTACLLPPHIRNAFHTAPRQTWQFCWVCYMQPPEQRTVLASSSPVMAKFDPLPLRHAIEGLRDECRGAAAPEMAHHWVELIQSYVLRFARPWQTHERLATLWDQVAANLAADWSLPKLARLAGCSPEHLRRLCHQQLGRSPKHHVIHLRMRRAAELLSTTREKVEHVAQLVGYGNPFVFSTTFKKWYGWSPSRYGQRRQGTTGA